MGFGATQPRDPIEAQSILLRFGREVFEPMPSGALHWRSEQTLLVADLHLEKFSSYAGSGQLLPPYDTGMTLRRLEADIIETGAQTVIALGDSFHRESGTTSLLDGDRLLLDTLTNIADWIWLSGNHDPSPHRLGGVCYPHLARNGLFFMHEPDRGVPGLIAGHLHPAARVVINGRSVRRPCFIHDGMRLVLPAYGIATGSMNVLSPAFSGLFDWPDVEIIMLGKGRLYPVSPKRLVAG